MIRERLKRIKQEILSGKRNDYAVCADENETIYTAFISEMDRLPNPPKFYFYSENSPGFDCAIKRMAEVNSLYLEIKHICNFMQK